MAKKLVSTVKLVDMTARTKKDAPIGVGNRAKKDAPIGVGNRAKKDAPIGNK